MSAVDSGFGFLRDAHWKFKWPGELLSELEASRRHRRRQARVL